MADSDQDSVDFVSDVDENESCSGYERTDESEGYDIHMSYSSSEIDDNDSDGENVVGPFMFEPVLSNLESSSEHQQSDLESDGEDNFRLGNTDW